MKSLLAMFSIVIISTSIIVLDSGNAFGLESRTIQTTTPPHIADVNVKTNTMYVGDHYSSVTVIDIATEKIINQIDLDDADFSIPDEARMKVVVNPDSNKIYAISRWSPFVYVIDGSTNNVIDKVRLGEHIGGLSIAVNPVTNKIYVGTGAANFVYVLDGSTNSIVEKLYIGEHFTSGGASFAMDPQLAVNPNTELLYATNFPAKLINVIDGSSNKIVANITTNDYPTAVAVDTDTDTIYAAGSTSLLVIDGSSHAIITEIAIVGATDNEGIYVNPQTNRVYTVTYSGPLKVIDSSSNTLLREIRLGIPVQGIAGNQNTNMLYLVGSDSNTILVLNATDIEKESRPRPFNISTEFKGETYTITGTTNNTKIAAFSVNPERSSIEIKVDGKEGDIELTLPTDLISGIQSIRIEKWGDRHFDFEEVASNPTSTTIQFSVPVNGGSIEIIGAKVVPEFPIGAMIAAVAMAFMLGIMRLWNVKLVWW